MRNDENNLVEIVKYDKEFLELSWKWLNDEEIKILTMSNGILSREMQEKWFNNIKAMNDYRVYGVKYKGIKIGAAGLKNINDNGTAEYWGYIGEKEYWGKGIGKYIVSKIIEKAEEMRIRLLYLKVAKHNSRAIRLYESQGFKMKHEEEDIFVMIREV